MPTTSTEVANRAIQMMGDNQPPVTGVAPNFDSSTAGIALRSLYAPCVRTVARQFEWDFGRKVDSLVLTANTPAMFTFEYAYPANAVQVWQIRSPTADPYNPVPENFIVGNNVVNGSTVRVIQTNVANAQAIYDSNPPESAWDDLFAEAVVRLLASELAIALAGKPDVAQVLLQSGAAFEAIAEQRSN